MVPLERRFIELGAVAGPLGAAALLALQAAGAIGPLPAPSLHTLLLMVVVAPIVEELAFREGVQGFCAACIGWRDVALGGLVTPSNALTTLAFAACHLPHQSPGMACALVLPSLLLGRVRELSGSLVPCIVLHAWFNACYVLAARHGPLLMTD